MPQLETIGGAVEYVVIDGRDDLAPLVFLHHGVGSIAGWFRFHAALAAATGRRALAYSRHGYGSSAPAPAARTMSYLQDEACTVLPDILDQLDFQQPVLVGNSEGASIALIHAALSHRPVSQLVLLSPLVFMEPRCREAIEAMARDYFEGDLRARVAMVHDDPDAAFTSWYHAWSGPDTADWSIADLLPQVRQPALLVYGTRDLFITAAQLEVITERAAGPTSRVDIRRAIHQTFVTHPAETLAAVVGYLEQPHPEPAGSQPAVTAGSNHLSNGST